MVNSHGDRTSPNWGYSPSKWPKWLVNGGNYLLAGMILQVVGWLASWLVLFCWSAKMSCLRAECTILTFTSVFGWLGPGEFQFG